MAGKGTKPTEERKVTKTFAQSKGSAAERIKSTRSYVDSRLAEIMRSSTTPDRKK